MQGSRVYAVAVLRPLAEQLVDLAAVGSGASVLDVGPVDATLTRVLAPVVGPARVVTLVDDEQMASALRDELHAARIDATVVTGTAQFTTQAGSLPFADAAFDVAVSLLGITSGRGGEALLGELRRVARRAVVVAWDGGATAEEALLAAWTTVHGEAPLQLRAALQPPAAPGWSRRELADVARVDSVRQLLVALIERHDLGAEAADEAALAAVLQADLARFTGADGTLRIPFTATVLLAG